MKRDKSIDSIAGLLILQMIIYHLFLHAALTNTRMNSITYPLFFFMPWFFYKAGFYYKPLSVKESIMGGLKKLLCPFVIFSLMGQIVYGIHVYLNGDRNFAGFGDYLINPMREILWEGSCFGNSALWFLVSLFVVKVVYNKIARMRIKDAYIIVVFACTAFLMNMYSISKPLYMANICSGMAFYSIGHFIKEYQYNNKLFLASIFGYILAILCGWNYIDMRTNIAQRGYYLLWIPTALAGIILINNIFKRIGGNAFLAYIGKNAIIFYVLHWIILITAKIFSDLLMVSDKHHVLLLMVLFEIIILPISVVVLSSNKLKWMIGK